MHYVYGWKLHFQKNNLLPVLTIIFLLDGGNVDWIPIFSLTLLTQSTVHQDNSSLSCMLLFIYHIYGQVSSFEKFRNYGLHANNFSSPLSLSLYMQMLTATTCSSFSYKSEHLFFLKKVCRLLFYYFWEIPFCMRFSPIQTLNLWAMIHFPGFCPSTHIITGLPCVLLSAVNSPIFNS